MNIRPTELPDVVLIEPQLFRDDRGFFMESYQEEKYFQMLGFNARFVQDNHSGSKQGVLRGLHYQIQQPQGKLIWLIAGEIFDVAVDLRRNSPSFGKSACIPLSSSNKAQLWIPPGFAHGFYVLSDWAEVLYKATDYYAPQWERTLLWNDPALCIDWPLVSEEEPLVSPKDADGCPLSKADLFD